MHKASVAVAREGGALKLVRAGHGTKPPWFCTVKEAVVGKNCAGFLKEIRW